MVMSTTFTQLIGSPKQKAYALRVLAATRKKYPDKDLLSISNKAVFWIANREHLDAILTDEKAAQMVTPFSCAYPLDDRSEAIEVVKALEDDFVVLDLATTGWKRNEHEIVEIAMMHASGVTLMDTLVRPVDLSAYLASDARLLQKIDPQDLLVAPSFTDCVPTILDIVSSYPVVAYNTSFDIPFLQYAFLRYGLSIPKINATCAMRIFTAFMKTDTHSSLENACKMLKIEHRSAHRAKADVLGTLELLRKIAASEA